VRLAKPPMFQLTTRFASVALVVFKVSHPILYEHHDDKIIMIMIMKNTKSRKLPSMGSLWFCGCECVLFFFLLVIPCDASHGLLFPWIVRSLLDFVECFQFN
jgi:hypothetical protein